MERGWLSTWRTVDGLNKQQQQKKVRRIIRFVSKLLVLFSVVIRIGTLVSCCFYRVSDRSHIGRKGEQDISYKGVETSPLPIDAFY